jgi:hypothetical protein
VRSRPQPGVISGTYIFYTAALLRSLEGYFVSWEVGVVGFHGHLDCVPINGSFVGVGSIAEGDGEGDLVAVDFAVDVAGLLSAGSLGRERSGELGAVLLEDVGARYGVAVAGIFCFPWSRCR